jgi:hypothetical protein
MDSDSDFNVTQAVFEYRAAEEKESTRSGDESFYRPLWRTSG